MQLFIALRLRWIELRVAIVVEPTNSRGLFWRRRDLNFQLLTDALITTTLALRPITMLLHPGSPPESQEPKKAVSEWT